MAKQQDKANEHGTQTTQDRRPEQSLPHEAARRYGTDEIARRAYERFIERGGQHGHDMDDWFEAERELQSATASETATPPHGDELAPQQLPAAGVGPAGARPKTPRSKKRPNSQRPDRAADQH